VDRHDRAVGGHLGPIEDSRRDADVEALAVRRLKAQQSVVAGEKDAASIAVRLEHDAITAAGRVIHERQITAGEVLHEIAERLPGELAAQPDGSVRHCSSSSCGRAVAR
jgi:hypothetical protein